MFAARLMAGLLLATALSAPAALGAEPLRGVALVIGESDYAVLPDLPNPRQDARALDDVLDDLGFDVSRVLDGDADDLRDEIADFIADAADADVALVYYSGHGVELGGRNYLVPVDTDLSTPQRAGQSLVAVDEMLDALARTVPITIVLLDACRTSAFPAGQEIELPGASVPVVAGDPGLDAMRGPTPVARQGASADGLGMVIGFAASPGQAALDGEPGGNSPYAAALLKHLRAGGYEFGDLMTLVSEEVYLETDARQLPWTNSSLRRLLTFGEAVEDAGTDDALIREGRRNLLLTVAATPPATRTLVEAAATAEGVPLEALYGMLKVLGIDAAAGDSIETQLRQGAEQLKTIIAQRPVVARTDEELIRLADLALRAEEEGAIDVALRFREQAATRADELARHVDADEELVRQNRLEIAATYVDYANTASLNFDFAGAAARYHDAFAQVEKWDTGLAIDYLQWQADALYYAGYYAGDLQPLRQAVAVYEQALALAPREERLESWGVLQNNLGLAYTVLGDWGGDVADLARAEEAFRNVLIVWAEDGDKAQWALAQGNYAGVLSKLGQRFVDAERLRQSVTAYEAALAATDPAEAVSYARAQTNYGTSIVLLATETGDYSRIDAAVAAFRHALTVLDVATQPAEWTITQNSLGSALKLLGDSRRDPALLEQAVDAYRAVIEAPGTNRSATDWGATQNNLGNTLVSLARVTGEASYIEEALEADRQALGVISREATPLNWANVQNSLGTAWFQLANLRLDPSLKREAVAAYRLSLQERTRQRVPLLWAETQQNLGNALRDVGTAVDDTEALHQAVAVYRETLEIYTRDTDEKEWAATIGSLGWALVGIARLEADIGAAEESVDAIRQSLEVWTIEEAPYDHGLGQVNLSVGLGILGILREDATIVREALDTLGQAEALYARLGYDDGGSNAGLRAQLESFIPMLEAGDTQ
jgi:uncharacterized caspase-like protein